MAEIDDEQSQQTVPVVLSDSGDFPASHSEYELPDIPNEDTFRNLIVLKYLEGVTTPGRIAKALGRKDLYSKVYAYMLTQEFNVKVRNAKRDMESSVRDTIKGRLHKYLAEMDEMATAKRGDPRVKFLATKDLLDRGGTGAVQKFAVATPSAYKKAIEEFTEDDVVDVTPQSGEK